MSARDVAGRMVEAVRANVLNELACRFGRSDFVGIEDETSFAEDGRRSRNLADLSVGGLRAARESSAFLDEPTAGLDPISAAQFDTLVRGLQQSLHLTVFMVTHDIDTLPRPPIAVLVNGKLTVGTIASLRDDANPWIHEYFAGVRGRAALAA